MSDAIRVGITGAAGRMGVMLVREVVAGDGLRLAGAAERGGAPQVGLDAGTVAGVEPLGVSIVDDLSTLVSRCDGVIDFTTPEVCAQIAPLLAEHRCPAVIGTTGLGEAQRAAIERAARDCALVWAPNMSVGVNLLLDLVRDAARRLGGDYDIEVIEAHHRHKKDAPSGTAMRIAEVLADATAEQGSLEQRACYGRQGLQPRREREIGIHTVRGGDIAGEHRVMFCGEGERIELVHRASSRQVFARGAVRALRWVVDRDPGLYTMRDVLDLRPEAAP